MNLNWHFVAHLFFFFLHLLLYAWVHNLVILYHIFFANLNHLLMYLIFSGSWFFAAYSFFLYFSNLYGYEIDFVSFKDLEQRFFLLHFPDFPKTLFIHVSTTFQRFIFYEYANFMIFHWLNRIFFILKFGFLFHWQFFQF